MRAIVPLLLLVAGCGGPGNSSDAATDSGLIPRAECALDFSGTWAVTVTNEPADPMCTSSLRRTVVVDLDGTLFAPGCSYFEERAEMGVSVTLDLVRDGDGFSGTLTHADPFVCTDVIEITLTR